MGKGGRGVPRPHTGSTDDNDDDGGGGGDDDDDDVVGADDADDDAGVQGRQQCGELRCTVTQSSTDKQGTWRCLRVIV